VPWEPISGDGRTLASIIGSTTRGCTPDGRTFFSDDAWIQAQSMLIKTESTFSAPPVEDPVGKETRTVGHGYFRSAASLEHYGCAGYIPSRDLRFLSSLGHARDAAKQWTRCFSIPNVSEVFHRLRPLQLVPQCWRNPRETGRSDLAFWRALRREQRPRSIMSGARQTRPAASRKCVICRAPAIALLSGEASLPRSFWSCHRNGRRAAGHRLGNAVRCHQ